MMKKLSTLLLILFAAPAFVFAQTTGKVAGKVTDRESGEPLALANVIIDGTTLGAATDENGDYVILNVPPGTYTLKARYLGYTDAVTSNIGVNAGLTRTVNFGLSSEDVLTEVVEVIADRPLINPNITNTTTIKTADDIANLPVRGVNNIVALQGGVVSQGGNLYIRGSRSDETKFYIDGVNVTNPLFGGSTVSLIDNAIEEIQVQTGGSGAEFGGANGGVVSSTMRTGSSNFKVGFEYLTDGFGVEADETAFGLMDGFSRGYNEAVLSVSGPVPGLKGLSFYAAGRFNYREAASAWRDGVDNIAVPTTYSVFDVTTNSSSISFDSLLTVSYPKYVPASERTQYDLNANVSYNLNPFNLKVTSVVEYIDYQAGAGTANYDNLGKVGEGWNMTQTHVFKFTHTVDPTMFYNLSVSYFNDYQSEYDPDFKHNVVAYGDPADERSFAVYNADKTNIFTKQNPFNFSQWSWNPQGYPVSAYFKQDVTTFGVTGDVTKQFGRVHEVRAGFEWNKSTVRRLSYGPFSLKLNLLKNGLPGGEGLSGDELMHRLARLESADMYGYDIYGNEYESGDFDKKGLNGPKEPVFASAFISDKMEYQDLVLNLGLRYDYIDAQGFKLGDGNSFSEGELGMVDASTIDFQDAKSYVSPRVGMSFPVTDRTTFHANYGQYIQQSRLRDIYLSWHYLSRILLSGGNAFTDPVGFDIQPTRTTSYEIGFKQQISENAAFDLTAFYNNKQGQIQIRQVAGVQDGQAGTFYGYQNGDFSTTTGFQAGLTLRRTSRVQANLQYTYSDARGTGSQSGSQFGAVRINSRDLPNYNTPLDYDQRHRGSVEVDYRFAANDGPDLAGMKVLENFGANVLFTFNSGNPYTRIIPTGFSTLNSRPIETTNASATPWVAQVDLRLDKTLEFGSVDMNIYMRIENLLNSKNVLDVFPTSGDANDDGWLQTVEGSKNAAAQNQLGPYTDLYNAYTNQNNPGFFNTPRSVIFGVRVDL